MGQRWGGARKVREGDEEFAFVVYRMRAFSDLGVR